MYNLSVAGPRQAMQFLGANTQPQPPQPPQGAMPQGVAFYPQIYQTTGQGMCP